MIMADVGAIIQGIGGIVGGLSNYWANYETNVTNKNLQRETNEQNKELYYHQLAAAREQYERERQENRYLIDQAYHRSLPKEQVKALREAGINPAFAFDSGSFGSPSTQIGSPPSSPTPSAPTMVAPHMVAPDLSAFGQGISNAVNTFLAEQRQEADISYIKTKEVNETLETLARLDKYTYENKHLSALSDQIRQDMLWNQDTWEQRRKSISFANQLMEADAIYKSTQSDLNKQAIQLNIDQNNRAWMELSQFISESKSRISLNGHLGQMYDSQSNLNYSQVDINTEIWKDKKFYNSKIEEIYSNNKGQADAMLRKLNYETSVQGWKDFVRMFQGFIPFGGMYQ